MRLSQFFFSIWSLLFILFAYWQGNDPDAVIWVAAYAIAAILCVLTAMGKYFTWLTALVALVSFVLGIYFFPSSVSEWVLQEWQQKDLSMKTLDMEKARESFGLLIISVIMTLAALTGFRKKRSRKDDVKPFAGPN
jgi:lysylphosphatidylglycerol synthetase-like protein (DUF2156 family)